MKTETRHLPGPAWLRRGIKAVIRHPQLRVLFLAALAALALGAVKPASTAGADLLPRVGSWPGFTRGPAWDVAVAGHYAYLAIGEGGLIVLDVTDPAKPVRVGGYLPPGQTRHVRVAGSRAYLGTTDMDGWRGALIILDVSDPTRPRFLGSHQPGWSIRMLQVDGNRAYVGTYLEPGHWERDFFVLDISDPARPVTLSVDRRLYPHETAGIAVAGERAYVVSSGKLRVLDLSQPDSPTVLAELETDGVLGMQRGMQVVGDRLYLTCCDRELRIYDTGDPTAPRLLGRVESGGPADAEVQVVGNYACVTASDDGLAVIDVSNPARPVLTATLDTPGAALRLAVANGIAFVADYYGGLQLIDVRDPGQLALVASMETGMMPRAIRMAGEKAYLLSSPRDPPPRQAFRSPSRIEVVDVSNPMGPLLLGAYNSAREVLSLDVAGDLAYLGWTTATNTGFEIVDLRDPLRPVQLSDTPTTPPGTQSSDSAVRADGHYAYVTTTDVVNPNSPQWRAYPRLRIFDVSDPAEPVHVSQTDLGGGVAALEVLDDRAYLTFGSAVAVFDVRDRKAPAQLSSVRLPAADRLFVSEDYAYAAGWGGFAIVDLRRPTAPVVTGRYDTLGSVRDLSVNGHYLYAAEESEGVEVFDVSNAAQPLSIGHSRTLGGAVGIEVSGNYAYVAESGGGLGILSLARENVTLAEQPGDLTVAAGDTATFTVRAYGEGPLRYQWYAGESGDRSRPIAGANSPTFTTPPLTDPAAYWLRVSDSTGTKDSRTARVAIVPPVSVELLSRWPGAPREPSTAGFAVDVAVSGRHAFLADGEGGLRIIDVSDPAQPKPVGVHGRNARAVAVSGHFVYLVADTFQILDVTDPIQPKQIATLNEDMTDIFPAGDVAYFVSDLMLKVLDLRNPESPKIIASDALSFALGQPTRVGGMAFVGRYGVLGDKTGGLQILDLSVPGEPRSVGAYYSDADIWDVAWQGNVACLALGLRLRGGALDVMDMTDVQRPVRIARVSLPLANRIALMGSYACVTGQGLQSLTSAIRTIRSASALTNSPPNPARKLSLKPGGCRWREIWCTSRLVITAWPFTD